MSRRTSIILVVVTLLTGLIAGGWGTAIIYGRSTDRTVISKLVADASTTVVVLKRLRAGSTTNAIECLEGKLDSDLIGLGFFRDDPGGLKCVLSNVKALQMVKDYRTQFPYQSSSPGVDQAKSLAWDLLDSNGNR